MGGVLCTRAWRQFWALGGRRSGQRGQQRQNKARHMIIELDVVVVVGSL